MSEYGDPNPCSATLESQWTSFSGVQAIDVSRLYLSTLWLAVSSSSTPLSRAPSWRPSRMLSTTIWPLTDPSNRAHVTDAYLLPNPNKLHLGCNFACFLNHLNKSKFSTASSLLQPVIIPLFVQFWLAYTTFRLKNCTVKISNLVLR